MDNCKFLIVCGIAWFFLMLFAHGLSFIITGKETTYEGLSAIVMLVLIFGVPAFFISKGISNMEEKKGEKNV